MHGTGSASDQATQALPRGLAASTLQIGGFVEVFAFSTAAPALGRMIWPNAEAEEWGSQRFTRILATASTLRLTMFARRRTRVSGK
jgi:hypothetical protein